ncbi:claudin-10-like isoform X1 [Megalops cyprinoides]|uniref:claudin-10-like isoform X1 n=1 Tax=Megalops cyprinoides TaxID=118141 RepID=UPI0018656224|nr:claudin-10-like isoform X1 [Megalops cyprinoides]
MSSMSTEILAFVLAISGWVLISSTLPTDYWKVSSIDGTVITTATFWSNLWKTCVTDSTGVSNCKDFPSMLALDGYIQVCRGLMISAVCLGFFGSIFALVGMKCTKIGGSDKTKAKIACLAGVNFILSGLCSLTACSLYAHRITSEFFDPMFIAQKFELGAALFIGWAGSVLCILGGVVFCFSLSEGLSKRLLSYANITAVGSTPSFISKSNGKATENYHKGPPDYSSSSRQFGKNAYV